MIQSSQPSGSGRGIRLVLLVVLAGIVLAGCKILPEREPVGLYTPMLHFADHNVGDAVSWRLALTQPTASGQLKTVHILVRPLPNQIEVYPRAAWSQSPPGLLGDALLEALEADGRLPVVQRSSTGLGRDYELQVDLRAFELVLTDGPQASVRLRADLLRQPAGRFVASRSFQIEVPASGQDVDAAVSALGQGLEQLLPELIDWTVAQAQNDWQDSAPP